MKGQKTVPRQVEAREPTANDTVMARPKTISNGENFIAAISIG